MRILQITERYISGGTEVQTHREKKALEMRGHRVYLLTMDKNFEERLDPERLDPDNEDRWMNIPMAFNVPETFMNHTVGAPVFQKKIRNLVEAVKPDFIHINNVFLIPDDVYAVVKGYPSMQTIRDYMAICPTGTCVDDNGIKCNGYRFGNCFSCVHFKPRYVAKRMLMPRLNRRRLESVDYLVSPSQALATACTRNGLGVTCLNNPFDFSILKKTEPNTKSDIYMYYGKIAKIKGIAELVHAFEHFHKKHPEKKLWIVGKVDEVYEKTFSELVNSRNSGFIIYKGVMSNDAIMDLYREIYCVVVPSLWIENYPNTVLEAIANKTLVIGSNRGGIPELIGDESLLFDVLDGRDILRKLERTAVMEEDKYREIVDKAYRRISENNTIDGYIRRFLAIADRAITLHTRR